ncbi:MAG: hypothetical protein QOE01_17 [Actinomycetota bacterium]|nr:hypothetical protein [Actinomycetota bacterium]
MSPLTVRARWFVVAVAVAAAPLPVLAVLLGHPLAHVTDLLALGLLLVLTDSVRSRLARGSTIALGSVASMAALPLVGAWGTILLACFNILITGPWVKRVFNTSQLILTAGAAGLTFTLLGGTEIQPGSFPAIILPFVAALAVHCAVNGLLVASIVHFTQGVRVRAVLQGAMAGSVTGYVGNGLFGLMLAVLWDSDGVGIGPTSAVLVLLPLFVARWAYEQYAEQQRAYDRTVRTLMAAVETKDGYTRGHSERVATASVLIARDIGMREDRVASLRYAGMLHDVGKLGVPTRVLQKAGRLTDGELAAIQRHPVQGREIVREIEFLDEAFAGIMHHHERLDGLGYPMGLQGLEIPEFARAIAVADAFDSMTTTRSYRGARSVEEAIEELRRCAGSQFDPVMVEALIAAIAEHGWKPETEPLFEPANLVVEDSGPTAAADDDDPTAQLSVRRSRP